MGPLNSNDNRPCPIILLIQSYPPFPPLLPKKGEKVERTKKQGREKKKKTKGTLIKKQKDTTKTENPRK